MGRLFGAVGPRRSVGPRQAIGQGPPADPQRFNQEISPCGESNGFEQQFGPLTESHIILDKMGMCDRKPAPAMEIHLESTSIRLDQVQKRTKLVESMPKQEQPRFTRKASIKRLLDFILTTLLQPSSPINACGEISGHPCNEGELQGMVIVKPIQYPTILILYQLCPAEAEREPPPQTTGKSAIQT